jgi:hypothetical protein
MTKVQKAGKVGIEMIGPVKAKALLKVTAPNQRNIIPSSVRDMAREMSDGKWILSGDSITIEDGKLVNGQNRLNAVIKSGTEQPFVVLYLDGSSHVINVLDCGNKRTIPQVLHMNGKTNTYLRARICHWVEGYRNHIRDNKTRNVDRFDDGLTRQDKIEWDAVHDEEIVTAISKVMSLVRRNCSIVSPFIGSALHVLIRNHDGLEKANDFVEKLYSNDPELRGLYAELSKLWANDKKGNKTYYPDRMALCIDAYNMWKINHVVMPNSVKLIQKPTPFPKFV